MTLILASGSRARRTLLANAGLIFEVLPADLDERAAEEPLLKAGATPEDIASALAMAKAVRVSELRPEALVIGADQTLNLQGACLVKPESMDIARRQLLSLSGRVHRLHSAVACARAGVVVWKVTDTAQLTMRSLGPVSVDHYLSQAGSGVLTSVGAYQLEGLGIQLFETIAGDYFTILGLPLLPLLNFLREDGVLRS